MTYPVRQVRSIVAFQHQVGLLLGSAAQRAKFIVIAFSQVLSTLLRRDMIHRKAHALCPRSERLNRVPSSGRQRKWAACASRKTAARVGPSLHWSETSLGLEPAGSGARLDINTTRLPLKLSNRTIPLRTLQLLRNRTVQLRLRNRIILLPNILYN
jgi:hypothetical protein